MAVPLKLLPREAGGCGKQIEGGVAGTVQPGSPTQTCGYGYLKSTGHIIAVVPCSLRRSPGGC